MATFTNLNLTLAQIGHRAGKKRQVLKETVADSHWTQSSVAIQEKSCLSKILPSTGASLVDLLLLQEAGFSRLNLESRSFLRYLFQYEPKLAHLVPLFERAWEQEDQISALASRRVAKKDLPDLCKTAAEIAAATSKTVAGLAVGQPYLLFSCIPQRTPDLEMWGVPHAYIFNDLIQNKSCTSLVDLIAREIESHPGFASVEALKGNLQKLLDFDCHPDKCGSILEGRPFFQKMVLAPLAAVRVLVLEQAAEIFAQLKASGLGQSVQKDLRSRLADLLQPLVLPIRSALLKTFEQVHNVMPSQVTGFLRLYGGRDFGAPHEAIWIEIEKQASGNYSLVLFTPDTDPIQFKEIAPRLLDPQFFYLLWSARLTPEWDPQVHYTLHDVKEMLANALNTDPETYLSSRPGVSAPFFSRYLPFASPAEESQYCFDLRQRIVFDAWTRLEEQDSSFAGEVRSAANALALEAADRCKRGLLSSDEMGTIFATTQEMAQSESSQQTLRLKRFPPSLMPILTAALQGHIDLGAEMIMGALRGAKQDPAFLQSIEEAIQEVRAHQKPVEAPPLSAQAMQIADAALQISLGISFRDVQKPSYWSYVKLACLTARIAVAFFFPRVGLQFQLIYVTTQVASYAFSSLTTYFFSDAMHRINRWKYRMMGYGCARFFLPKEQISAIEKFLEQAKAFSHRSGTISFKLDAPPPSSPHQSVAFQWHLTSIEDLASIAPALQVLQAPAVPFIPSRSEIRPDNVVASMKSWLANATLHFQGQNKARELVFYLCDQMKTLQVPLPDGADDFWSQVPDVYGALNEVGHLMFTLFQAAADKETNLTKEPHAWIALTLFKGYAIIDKLARRCPEAHLDHLMPNGAVLSLWPNNYKARLVEAHFQDELIQLQRYFKVDPTNPQTFDGTLLKSDYLKHLVDQEETMRQKLAAIRYGSSSLSQDEYLEILRADQAFDARKLTVPLSLERRAELDQLFLEGGRNPHKGPLPRAVFMLRAANQLANTFIGTCARPLPISSLEEFQFNVKEEDHMFRPLLHAITGRYGKEPGAFDISHPFANVVFGDRTFNLMGTIGSAAIDQSDWIPTSITSASLHGDLTFATSSIVANFLHAPPRTQNEIINTLSSFQTLRPVQPSAIQSWLPKLLSETRIDSNQLSRLSEQERQLFEMIRVDREDRIVRLIAYFYNFLPELCTSQGLFHVFQTILLQGDGIYRTLKRNPELGRTLGQFFTDLIARYKATERGRQRNYVEILQTAIYVREEVIAAAPDGGKWFPPLREECQVSAPSLVVLPYLFADPLTMPLGFARTAVQDICLSRFDPLKIDQNKEIYAKWRGKIQEMLDHDPTLLNGTLNQILRLELPNQSDLAWEGSFPLYKAGIFTINLDLCESSGKRIFDRLVAENIGSIVGSKLSSNRSFFLNVLSEIVQPPGRQGSFLRFSRLYQHQRYYLVSVSDDDPPVTRWVSDRQADGTAHLLVLKDGQLVGKPVALKQNEPHAALWEKTEFEIEPEEIQVQNISYRKVSLQECSHHLFLLANFDSLSNVEAYVRSDDPSSIGRIVFTKFGLSFAIQDGRAVGEGALANLTICPVQQHPKLSQYARCLLLEDSSGRQKVLLPAEKLFSTAALAILKKVDILPEQPWLEALLCQQLDGKSSSAYLYDLDAEGRLSSNQIDATLHLLSFHAFRADSTSLVRHQLTHLEHLSKLHPFSKDAIERSVYLQLAWMHNSSFAHFATYLAGVMEQNILVHAIDETSRELNVLSLVAIRVNSFQSFQNRAGFAGLPFDHYKELLVLHAMIRKGMQIGSRSLWELFDFLTRHASQEEVMKLIFLRPEEIRRYHRLLQECQNVQGSQLGDVARIFLSTSSSLTGALGGATDPGSLFSLVQGALSGVNKAVQLNALDGVRLCDMMCGISEDSSKWDTVPTNFWEMTPDAIQTHFCCYELLARGKCPDADISRSALFQQKSTEFRRSLELLYTQQFVNSSTLALVIYLHGAMLGHSVLPITKRCFQNLIWWDQLVRYCKAQAVTSTLSLKNLKRKFKQYGAPAIRQAAISFAPSYVMQAATRASASSLAGFCSPAAVTGITLAARCIRTCVQARRERRQFDQELAEINSHRMVPDAPLILPPEFFQEDALVGHGIAKLVSAHFAPVVQDDAAVQQQVVPFDADSGDQIVRRCFASLNTSLHHFYDKTTIDSAKYQLASADALDQLKDQLDWIQDSLRHIEEDVRAELIHGLVPKTDPNRADHEVILDILQPKEQIEPSAYLEKHLSNFGKTHFDPKVFYYLLLTTRLHQVERALKMAAKIGRQGPGVETNILIQQLVHELSRTRAYGTNGSFNHASSRFVARLMLFEHGTSTMLWQKQVAQIEQMLLGQDPRTVLELTTGSGKTFFGIPMTGAFGSNGRHTVVHVFPDALVPICTQQVATTAKAVFGQMTHALRFSRNQRLDKDVLWGLLFTQRHALHRLDAMSIPKRDLQAFQLIFLEKLFTRNKLIGGKRSERDQELTLFKSFFKQIQEHWKLNVDEAHIGFRRKHELNHPLGAKDSLPPSYVQTIALAVAPIAALPALNQNEPISLETYQATIKPLLIEALSKDRFFCIRDADIPLFIEYISEQAIQTPDFILNHPKRSEINLAAWVINELLPSTLQNKIFVDHGPSLKDNGEYARPYSGNNTSNETATFKNPFEAVVKTCHTLLYTKLSQDQYARLILRLKEMAFEEAEKTGCLLNQTRAYEAIFRWTNGACSLDSINPSVAYPILKDHPSAILAYARLVVSPEIQFFAQNFRCDSYDFAAMFPQGFYSATASPNQPDTFPTQTKIVLDQGNKGEFVDLICHLCDDPRRIAAIDTTDPQKTVEAILNDHFLLGSTASAIIDSGALFHGIAHQTVAEMICGFLEEHRPDLEGVVFYDANQELVFLRKGTTTPVPFAECNVPPAQRLTYYDHSHAVGADIVQPPGAQGVLTLSATSTLEEFAQGAGRMRGLKTAGQTLQLVVPKSLDGQTIRDIVMLMQTNEARAQPQENFMAAQQKIRSAIRGFIFRALIDCPDVLRSLAMAQEFEPLFIDQFEIDPWVLYSPIKAKQSPYVVLDTFKRQQFEQMKQSRLFSEAQKEALWDELEPIGCDVGIYPDEVAVRRDDAGNLRMGQEMGVSQEVTQTQEQQAQVQQTRQQTVNQNVQAEQDQEILSPEETEKIREELAIWDAPDYLGSLEWLKTVPFQISSKHRTVLFHDVEETLTHTEILSDVSSAFKGKMWWTNNFLGICDGWFSSSVLDPFHSKKHRPILQLVVIQAADEIYTIAVTQKEAAMWRGWLQAERASGSAKHPNFKFALFDLGIETITDYGFNQLTDLELLQNAEFRKSLQRWKYLAGHTQLPSFNRGGLDCNRKQEYDQWLQDSGQADALKKAFVSVHKIRGVTPWDGSDIVRIHNGWDEWL